MEPYIEEQPRSFTEKPLRILRELAHEPMAPVDELRKLKQQIDVAIGLIEIGNLVTMNEFERNDHASRFGKGAFVVGDYVITKRNAT